MKSMIILTIFCATLFATGGIKGGRRLLTLNTARTLSVNAFTVSSGLNFFSETPEFGTGKKQEFNAWQVDGDVAMSYGVVENVETYIATRLYQDTHQKVNNFPSYIIIGAKYGNIEIDRKTIILGANIEFEFGIGTQQNIPFEDYASKGFSVSPQVSLSYFTDQFLPDRSFSLHLNLGLTQHFDNGKELYRFDLTNGDDNDTSVTTRQRDPATGHRYFNSQKNNGNSNSFNFGIGLNLPTELIDIMVELDGYTFLTAPSDFAFGREGRIVSNIAFRYKMSNFMSFDFGLGFNMSEGANLTNKIINDKLSKNTNYSTWRGFMGMNFSLQPTGTYSNSRNEIERNEYNRKIQTFKSLIEEQENTEVIQKELENLKDEREKAEKELEELKRILEDR